MGYFNEISTLQYMGSKSRILNAVCEPIEKNISIDTVVDLFAGTGTIGYALKPYYSIISNDLEYYAYILNEGILNGCFFSEVSETKFTNTVSVLLNQIRARCQTALSREQFFFDRDDSEYLEYKAFCEKTPSIVQKEQCDPYLQDVLSLIIDVNPGADFQNTKLPILFITYYSNTYFGINQCCEIDAIRGAISSVRDRRIQNVLLTILMTVMSSTASTTTHFAQYLKVNGKNSFKNIIAKRKVSIIHEFFILLKQYRERGLLDKNQTEATCKNLDYLELLNSIPLDESVMVYADPPYFKEHYSRYYHILNTVCKYDYPAITLNPQTQDFSIGRYREDRNISDFGKRKTALSAFRELINLCVRNSAWLTISYSDNSIVNISDILEIMRQQYTVDIVEIPLRHSNQGRASTSSVREYLLTGQPISFRRVVGQKQVCQLLEQLSGIKSETDNPAGLMHNYMARKPYNVVNEIIQQLCPKDGIVYDPMIGSGTTLIEASKLGYRAIGTDINPLAYRITKISLTNWNIEKLKNNINDFYNAVERECNALYEFEESNEIRVIERCHFNKNKNTLIPISYWYKIREKTKLSPRKKADSSELFTNNYQQFFNMPVTHVSNAPLIPNSRIAIGVDETVHMYFCARNLVVLDKIMEILKEYNQKYGYEVIELMVSSAINLIKLSDKKASSQMPYWIPKNNVTSRNAVMVLKQKRDAFLKGLEYLAENCCSKVVDNYIQLKENPGIIVKAIPAQNMSYSTLPRDSVDLVLTDPPYTDQVPYLEYGQLWTSIMKWDKNISKKLLDELVVSDAPSRNKGSDDFNTIFEKILKRTANSLKEGGHFVMFYHTFDLKSWDHILSVMQRNGFAYQGQAPIASPRKSFKTIMSPNSTLDGNYIIVFRKRKIHSRIFEGTLNEAETLAINCAKDIIRNHAHTTSQDLYDCGMLKDAVEKGYLGVLAQNYPTFIDIIFPHFDCTNGIWREKECIGC